MFQKKIAYFLSHPIQYFSPLFKSIAESTELEVYYFSDAGISENFDKGFGREIKWDTDLLNGYHFTILKNYSRRKALDNKFFDVFNPGVVKVLCKTKASVIIVNGWSYSSTLLVIFFGKLVGKKIWVRAENPLNQELKKSKKKIIIKKFFLQHFLFRIFIDKCLYIGKESKLFFQFYGIPETKLIYTPYSVDNVFFNNKHNSLKNDIAQLKIKLGLPADKKIILFSGKYIEKKRPFDLLMAYVRSRCSEYALVMVGEGELRKQMEHFIQKQSLQHVYLTGFVNQSEIAQYYEIADVFVMCSGIGETWGLSVNEAMNFEKPVIVSKTCGCSTDLVEEGINGFSFEEGDIEHLARLLDFVLNDEKFRFSAGKRSKEIVGRFSITAVADNIVNSLPKF
ncbi:MAG TPA: glycosyltransferase family 4 protein [Puia sp.]|nr:glycosyltransferase family 4 protein [Puia sp.]